MVDEDPFREPLRNLKIFVACSEKKLDSLKVGLQALGAEVLAFPLIEARAIEDNHLLDRAVESLERYDWIIFTSAYAVKFFMQRVVQKRNRIDPHDMPKVCAIGPATADAAREFDISVTLIPDRFVAEGVLDALAAYHGSLTRMSGCRILLPRAKRARDVLPETLAKAGVQVDIVACYETVCASLDEDQVQKIRSEAPDLMVFTSSSAVRALMDILGPENATGLLSRATVAVIGPVTAHELQSMGKSPEIVPEQSTIASLIEAVRRFYAQK